MNIFIVIPIFNRLAFTRACLLSLRKQTYAPFRIVVVDDGSTDGSPEMVETEFPEVHLIRGGGDLWWTATVNLGIEYALQQGATHIMTLNDDTLHPVDYLQGMVTWAQEKPEAVMGSLELDYHSGEIVNGGEYFDEYRVHYVVRHLSQAERKGLHPVTQLPGRGLWIPRTVFERIGLFDQQRFPHYLADFDFSYNAYRGGFEVYMNYDAPIYTYPEESGEVKNRRARSLQGYYRHLFNIKGGANLRDFTVYSLKNCPPFLLPYRLATGYSRRLIGYWIK